MNFYRCSSLLTVMVVLVGFSEDSKRGDFLPHKYYLSNTDIEIKEKQIECALKFFADDLEASLTAFSGHKWVFEKDSISAESEELLSQYIQQTFQVSSSKKVLDMQYVGFENDYDHAWIYVAFHVKRVKNLGIKMTSLFREFPEQRHLVHLKKGAKKWSSTLHKDRNSVEFALE